jgi:hypothetical protein
LNLSFHYTSAVVVSIIGAAITVAVSFGLNLSQDNIHSIMLLVGLLGGAITFGAGVKTSASIHADKVPVPGWLHFTPATVVSLAGAVIAVAVSFGVSMTQANIDSIMTLVGLIAGGIVLGGAAKSHAMITKGIRADGSKV